MNFISSCKLNGLKKYKNMRKQDLDQTRNRKVFWKYCKSGKNVTIKDNLTLKEAQEMVQEDQNTNPSVKVKMMCFDKM